MEVYNVFISTTILSLVVIIITKYLYSRNKIKLEKQPPSPPSRPFIGHLHLIKHPLHRALQDLSNTYGPIYFLKLGFVPTVVISSPKMVEECFTKNDMILANRPRRRAGKHINYEWSTVSSAPYGPLWRELRRIGSLELFSTVRLNMLGEIRDEEMKSLVKGLFLIRNEEEDSGNVWAPMKVKMRGRFSEVTFNVIMRMLTGKRYGGDEPEAKEFRKVTNDAFALSGASNPVDFFPFLRWIPFQNTEGKMLEIRKKMDYFLDGLIEECRGNRNSNSVEMGKEKAMIYTLLDLQESDSSIYSNQIIKGMIMIMLIAGTDTSAVTMEWALTLLLNNPEVLQKARSDIDNIVGHNRLINESDLSNLPYIHNIVNETLRLFPAAPLLVPHEASQDITISGYNINKGTMVLVNAWSLHRDPKFWDDPLKFKPERFTGSNSETFRSSWIPFGQGRRSCPGANLANKVVALNLAALIQCFEWETIDGKDVELDEGFGLTMPKVNPLEALCRPRKCMINVLSRI